MVTQLNEIEEKIQDCYPRFSSGLKEEDPALVKEHTRQMYLNKNNTIYKNKRFYAGQIEYSSLTEIEKLNYINEKVYVKEQVMVLVMDTITGTKLSVILNLVFNDYVKYRDREFFEKYAVLFDL